MLSRKLAVKNTDPCGDVLLDEALKHMKETEYPESIQVSERCYTVPWAPLTSPPYLPLRFIYYHL